ncbi:MAG TPA: tetratricopeptide repeat protein, partial [Gemmatimonadaceae bacterium]|nr:tetratricopeptide repeat protein [Gemmatimonadaceae bacterium]
MTRDRSMPVPRRSLRRTHTALLALALLGAVATPHIARAQGETPAPLSKSDLVRYLSSATYSKTEIAGIVRRSCLAFTPTARDRDDLRALGATSDVMTAIESCTSGRKRASAVTPRTSTPRTNTARSERAPRPAPPAPLQLRLPQSTLTLGAGNIASIEADVRRGDAPASGVRLVLRGAEQIPGGAHQPITSSTDASGRAIFPVPAGTSAGSYQLTIAPADDGTTLHGANTLVLVTTPASPTSAEVSPSIIQLTARSPSHEDVVATVRDPFGNAAAFQRIELRPVHTITGLASLSATTDSSGIVHFALPTAPLRDDDTLAVAVGDRVLATIPVSAAGQITAQMLQAARFEADNRPDAAAAVYDSVLQAEPTNVRALLGRGAVRSLQNKTGDARQDYLAVLHLDDNNTAALTGLGYTYARSGDFATAARRFEQALHASPDESDAATGLAYAELWQFDSRQAARRSDVLDVLHPAAYPVEAAERMRAGIEQLRQRNLPAAQYAFTAAISAAPTWADAYFNRAMVYEAEGRPERALPDLQKYLQLRPNASDRGTITQHIDALRIGNPGTVLTRGLLAPGLGQLSTGRPAIGAAVLAGVVGSAMWALSTQTTTETRHFSDPFGNPYTDQVAVQHRPHLAVGAALAGTVWVLGAVEAYLHTV